MKVRAVLRGMVVATILAMLGALLPQLASAASTSMTITSRAPRSSAMRAPVSKTSPFTRRRAAVSVRARARSG